MHDQVADETKKIPSHRSNDDDEVRKENFFFAKTFAIHLRTKSLVAWTNFSNSLKEEYKISSNA